MGTFVQGILGIIRALVTSGSGGVWGRIWGQEVLSEDCMESVDPDADSD